MTFSHVLIVLFQRAITCYTCFFKKIRLAAFLKEVVEEGYCKKMLEGMLIKKIIRSNICQNREHLFVKRMSEAKMVYKINTYKLF